MSSVVSHDFPIKASYIMLIFINIHPIDHPDVGKSTMEIMEHLGNHNHAPKIDQSSHAVGLPGAGLCQGVRAMIGCEKRREKDRAWAARDGAR